MAAADTAPDPAEPRGKYQARHVLLVIALLIMLVANVLLVRERNQLRGELEVKDQRIEDLLKRLQE